MSVEKWSSANAAGGEVEPHAAPEAPARRRASLALALGLAGGLGGCADYLVGRDGVSLGAGDAVAWNRTVHVADPWPPYVMNTHIPGDGQRTAGVIRRYSTGEQNAGPAPDPAANGPAPAPAAPPTNAE